MIKSTCSDCADRLSGVSVNTPTRVEWDILLIGDPLLQNQKQFILFRDPRAHEYVEAIGVPTKHYSLIEPSNSRQS